MHEVRLYARAESGGPMSELTPFEMLRVMIEDRRTIYQPVSVEFNNGWVHINDSMGNLLSAEATLELAIRKAYRSPTVNKDWGR